MKHTFMLPIKGFSINSFYTANRRFKTSAAREWTITVQHFLKDSKIQKKLENLRDYFNPQKHVFEITLKFYYPKNKLFSSTGGISSKSFDCSNVEKPLIDILFLPKYFEETPNLNIDDKYIVKLLSEKKISRDNKSYYIEIEIVIKDFSLDS